MGAEPQRGESTAPPVGGGHAQSAVSIVDPMSLLPPRVMGPVSECSQWVSAHYTIPGASVTVEVRAPDGSSRVVGSTTANTTITHVPLDPGEALHAGDQVNAYQEDGGGDVSEVSWDGPIVQDSVQGISPVQVLTVLTKCSMGFSLGGMRPGTTVDVFWQGGPIGSGVAHEGIAHVRVPSGLPGPLPAGALTARQRVCPKPPPPPPSTAWILDSALAEVMPSPIPPGDDVPPPKVIDGLVHCSRAVEVADIVPGAEVILEGRDRGWFIALGAGDHSTAKLHLPVSLEEGETVVAKQTLGEVCETRPHEEEHVVGPRTPDPRPQLSPISCAQVPVLWGNFFRAGADVEFEVVHAGVPSIHRTVVVDTDRPLPAPPMSNGDSVRVRQGGCGEWSDWSDPQVVHALTAEFTTPQIPHELFECQDMVEVINISPLIGILRIMSDQRGELARVVPTGDTMVVPVAPSLTAGHQVWVERDGCGMHTESDARVVGGGSDVTAGEISEPLFDGDTEVTVKDLVAGARVSLWDASSQPHTLITSGRASSSDTGQVDVRFTGFSELRAGWQVYAQTSHCGQFRRTDHVNVGYRPPELDRLSPRDIPQGSPGATVVATGAHFRNGAVMLWNGSARATTYQSRTEIRANIPAADIASAGTFQVQVRNPDGQRSSTLSFTVIAPAPPPPVGYDEFVIVNCNSNFIPGTNLHREVHIYFRLASGGPWVPINDSPHDADYDASGTCVYQPGGGARLALDDGKEYEVVVVDRYLAGCNGDPDQLACRRSPVWRVRGKSGGGEKVVYVN